MTYRIEITADSLAELGGKALALGIQLGQAQSTAPAAPMAAAKKATTKPAETTAAAIVAQEAAQEPPPPVDNEHVAEGATPFTAEEIAVNAEQDTGVEAETYDKPVEIDFDRDVAKRVITLVQLKGKPAAEAIMGAFGVGRASEVPASEWPKLIEALDEALEG
jgi:hypothetical protein